MLKTLKNTCFTKDLSLYFDKMKDKFLINYTTISKGESYENEKKKILEKVTFGLLMFGFMFLFNGNIKADTTVTTEAQLQ